MSLPRYRILEEKQDKMVIDTALTSKSLSDTRWASRKQATEAVLKSMPAIIEALDVIINEDVGSTPKAAADAQGLLATIETFEFMFMLNFWNFVLEKTFCLSNYLQKSSIDLISALAQIDSCASTLKQLKSDEGFEEIEKSAKEKAEECKISTEFKQGRVRKRKLFHDEVATDEPVPISDSRTRFKEQTFFHILSVFDTQFETRFKDLRNTACKFQVLNEKYFFDKNSIQRINELAEFYSEDLDAECVEREYCSFRDVYKQLFPSPDGGGFTTAEILPFLIANDLHEAYPNVATLYRIFLTVPISSAQAERTFSRLKLIKTYLRSTMSETRLSHLATLYIEREVTATITFDNAIETFARMKKRKTKL